jgi:alpha/beta superfamily hydrolase
VHGEQDDTVPLASVLDWARPQSLPITVIPGGEHFFHGQLPLLKSLVIRHLKS